MKNIFEAVDALGGKHKGLHGYVSQVVGTVNQLCGFAQGAGQEVRQVQAVGEQLQGRVKKVEGNMGEQSRVVKELQGWF